MGNEAEQVIRGTVLLLVLIVFLLTSHRIIWFRNTYTEYEWMVLK